MAKQLTSALPLPQSKNLHLILGTQLHQKPIIISSWTRIFSPILSNPISISINTNKNVFSRRFASISATSLPSLSYCHLPLHSSCHCLCFSSLSLLPLCRSRLPSLRLLVMSASHTDTINEQGPTTKKTIRCVIKGRVQGVFYRNWTIENASQLGLKGWVRNRRDGSVEALFSGEPEAVDEMLQRCRRGPPDAMVTAIEANPSQEDPGPDFVRMSTV